MTEQHDTDRWKYIRGLHFEYADFYDLLGTALVAIFVILFIRAIFPPDGSDFDMNLTTEIIGIVITIFVIDRRNSRRELRRYQQQLVDEAASTSNETAKHAIHTIRRKEWLEADASILRGKNLIGSNLEAINLSNANLRGTYLDSANLQMAVLHKTVLTEASLINAKLRGAQLLFTELQDAFLSSADLREAIVTGARLQNAKMVGAMLQNADLTYANLQNAVMESVLLHGTNLSGANLQGVRLRGAVLNDKTIFDAETILPDGSRWSSERDLKQFTDRNHPDFQWYYRAPK